MSSQGSHEVPLGIARDQEPFRLLELPSEVVQLLESPSPPLLQFKSTEDGHVALCLPQTTFQLRQVSTSNSVHIIRPRGTRPDELHDLGLVSIAQCDSTLETVNEPARSAEDSLRASLPVFTPESGTEYGSASFKSKRQTFDDIPLSDSEIAIAWTNLCAFETDDGAAVRPSPRLLVRAWSEMCSKAIIDGLDLTKPVQHSMSVDAASQTLVDAIFRRLASSEGQTKTLDRKKTVMFVGETLLQDLQESSTSDFVAQWQNLLPERWRGDADPSLLQDICQSTNSAQIIRVKSAVVVTTSDTATSNTKRKWHDKFRNARKQ